MTSTPKPSTFANPDRKAKLNSLARKVARAVKNEGLTYEEWRELNRLVRKKAKLTPAPKGKRLPKILTDDQFRLFFCQVDKASTPLHSLMLRLLFYTGIRVSELCALKVSNIDLTRCTIRINEGKGKKDRTVLFGAGFSLTLKTYLASHKGEHLFQSRQGGAYSPRRIQQIVATYASKAGVEASPHTFRHQAITWLTRQGLGDAELQLITGHARRDTLAVYQHLALTDDLQAKYQDAMRKVDL